MILLADGYTIYNGPTSEARNFLDDLGYLQKSKYQNPADTLLKMAHCPKMINPKLDFQRLTNKVKESYKQPSKDYESYVAKNMSKELWKIEKKIGGFREWLILT